jgi:cytidine deaminase
MKPSDIDRLIAAAQGAMDRAIATYSGFSVGAALLDQDGKVYTGCNIENPSLMLSVCAEQVALTKALSEGSTLFKAIAISSSDERYCTPCGACRQLLNEFAPGLMIFMKSTQGIKKFTIEELLPHPFSK